ncbi:hypothetical protein LguiA_007431 [Lonicera macranthoides]
MDSNIRYGGNGSKDCAALLRELSFTSCNIMEVHGMVGLQSKVTTTFVAEFSIIFLYVISLIFTPEVYENKMIEIEKHEYKACMKGLESDHKLGRYKFHVEISHVDISVRR